MKNQLEIRNMELYKKITISFDAGQFSSAIDKLPDYAGLYFVYRTYKGVDGKWKVNHDEAPIYIGKAEDSVRSRMKEHENDMDITLWINDCCNEDDDLYICTAPVDVEALTDVEAALIYHIQPKANVLNKESYNGGNLHIVINDNYTYLKAANKNFYQKKS